jgi:hypothetical protein
MPVSVTARLEASNHAYDGVILRLRAEGQEVAIETTMGSLLQGGVVGFFDVAHGTLLRTGPQRRKRISKKQEKRIEELGGNAQPGSGSRPGYKSDGRIRGRYRVENKYTSTESFRVEYKDLLKIRSECVGLEVPVFEVQFRAPRTLQVRDEWVLIPRKEWEKHVHADDAG